MALFRSGKKAEATADRFSSPDYKRSRCAYHMQTMFEHLVYLLATDVFLAKLLSSLGIEDAVVGVISSLIMLAYAFQILCIFLSRWQLNSKGISLVFCSLLSPLSFTFLYLIPFLSLKGIALRVAVVCAVFGGHFFKYLVFSILYHWANAYVDPEKRAVFTTTREMIKLICGIVFSAAIGWAFERLENAGKTKQAFFLIAAVSLFLAIAQFVCMLCIKGEPKKPVVQSHKSFSDIFRNTLGNRNFRPLLLLSALANMGNYFSLGFLGTFKTNDLLIPVFTVQIINIVADLLRVLISRPFGRFADRTSFARGYEVSRIIEGIAFLCVIFTTRSTWFLMIPFAVCHAVASMGTGFALNLDYSYVDREYVTEAMAIRHFVGGVTGFGASLLAGKLLAYIQQNGNTLFGFPVYGQQVLAFISLLITLLAWLLTRLVIEKEPVNRI